MLENPLGLIPVDADPVPGGDGNEGAGQRRRVLDILRIRAVQRMMNLQIQSPIQPARLDALIDDAHAHSAFHFAEQNSNLVTLGAFDPISREPNFKQCAVRIERTH